MTTTRKPPWLLGPSHAGGDGFSTFAEYFVLETTMYGVADDETILMSGVNLGF